MQTEDSSRHVLCDITNEKGNRVAQPQDVRGGKAICKPTVGRMPKPKQTKAGVGGNFPLKALNEDLSSENQSMANMCETRNASPFVDTERRNISVQPSVSENACEIQSNNLLRQMKFLARPFPSHIQSEVNGTMRSVLLDWLVDVGAKYGLRQRTFFLAANYVDRFLCRVDVQKTSFQLIGCACLLIATKKEEKRPMKVKDFVYLSEGSFSREELFGAEESILRELAWEIAVPTIHEFAEQCMAAATEVSGYRLDEGVGHISSYLLELAVVDGCSNKYIPSQLAAAAVALACDLCDVRVPWNSTMELHSGTSQDAIVPGVEDLIMTLCHENDATGDNRLTAVKRKYSDACFKHISLKVIPGQRRSNE